MHQTKFSLGKMMSDRNDLKDWVHEAVIALGGEARIAEIAEHIWNHHRDELRQSGSLFYTWQYDMRWAAKRLRDEDRLAPAEKTKRGLWSVAE